MRCDKRIMITYDSFKNGYNLFNYSRRSLKGAMCLTRRSLISNYNITKSKSNKNSFIDLTSRKMIDFISKFYFHSLSNHDFIQASLRITLLFKEKNRCVILSYFVGHEKTPGILITS